MHWPHLLHREEYSLDLSPYFSGEGGLIMKCKDREEMIVMEQ